ncbi:MAG: hypothetical protein NTZ54_08045 [Alphaproteobacteria bacterium]|nr:hypothetical protein [Alphaproteobacteria bacterium]
MNSPLAISSWAAGTALPNDWSASRTKLCWNFLQDLRMFWEMPISIKPTNSVEIYSSGHRDWQAPSSVLRGL